MEVFVELFGIVLRSAWLRRLRLASDHVLVRYRIDEDGRRTEEREDVRAVVHGVA